MLGMKNEAGTSAGCCMVRVSSVSARNYSQLPAGTEESFTIQV